MMKLPKRTFSSFADDFDFSSPSLPDFSSILAAGDHENGVEDVGEGASEHPFILFPSFEHTGSVSNTDSVAEYTHEVLEEHFRWPEVEQAGLDPFTLRGLSSGPTTQDSVSSRSSQAPDQLRSTEPKNVCYGMIYLSKARLVGVMQEVMQELVNLKEGVIKSHFVLDIVWHENELFLALPSGLRAAQLNKQISEALQASVAREEVKLEALLHKESILNDIMKAPNVKSAETTVNINVYGTCSTLQTIGICLSNHKVWLQRPNWHTIDSTYQNPHVIRFANEQSPDTTIPAQTDNTVSADSASIQIENIYSQLSRADHLQGVAGDSRLTTRLLQHQEEALGFMIQRESGDIPDQFRLWQKEIIGEEVHYRHKITGQRLRTIPNEHGGGILADEMGTGKTLSTIALIIATLDAANAWAHDRETHLSENIPAFKTLSHGTLVVVPSPLILTTWKNELQKHTDLDLDIFEYHGVGRRIDLSHLAKRDIVLTTYHTLVADHARNIDLVKQIAWYRIVLDEAHFIRRSSTLLHKRVAELDAKFRWCLTGTPIQNSLDDVGSLFSFLDIAPFGRLSCFRRYISAKHAEGIHGLASAQQNLVKLLDAMCIRRTKDQINLCAVNEMVHYVKLSPQERRQYNSMKDDMRRAMHNITGESDSRQRFGSFQAILQLRLLCNHGTYQNHFHWAKNSNLLNGYLESFDRNTTDGTKACSICGSSDSMLFLEEDSIQTNNCEHTLCSTCKEKSRGQCPCCEHIAKSHNVASQNAARESWTRRDLQQEGHSSKMEALVQGLLASHDEKSVVFSCWTTTLDLVARYLDKHHISYERIDGEQSFSHRQKVLNAFSADSDISVLIMTTGVGAFGIDLIAANRVFLIEPQWNPCVESQAIGRTTRIGQSKTVQVIRYVAHDTVEEGLRDLQRRKRGIARMAEKDSVDSVVKAEGWELLLN